MVMTAEACGIEGSGLKRAAHISRKPASRKALAILTILK
jgi:hypothetical protein